MTEPRFPHLALRRFELQGPPRPRNPGRTQRRENAGDHGRTIGQQLEAVAGVLAERRDLRPLGINPRLAFIVDVDTSAVDDDAFRRLGLSILAMDGNRTVVVFPSDVDLEAIRTRVATYTETDGASQQVIGLLAGIREITPADRVGRRLNAVPLSEEEIAFLDVELWHSGSSDEMHDLIDEIDNAIRPAGEVLDRYVGSSLCLVRARATTGTVDSLLELDHVKEVDRRPEPSFDMIDLQRIPLDDYELGEPPNSDASGIAIVDTGLASHPLLMPVIADARSYVRDNPDPSPSHGHGTWVAGIAAYGDVGAAVALRTFRPTVWIYSAKVTHDGRFYDPLQLAETQLRDCVDELTSTYRNIRVINISLGDSRTPYVDGSYQSRLAAVVDELAYEFREREIVFVISAGNQGIADDAEQGILDYPEYLYRDQSRIIDPATSLIGLTVGALSTGEGAQAHLMPNTDRGIAESGWPSAFTRSGPGHAGSLKPDFVDYGGDARFSWGSLRDNPGPSGLPTTHDEFGPPEAQLFRTVAGTSFAAPGVSHTAARLFDAMPGASSNLVRCLLADSASIPNDRPPALVDVPIHDARIWRLYGHGRPRLDQAVSSETSRVALLVDDSMPLDYVNLFEVPELPAEFRTARGQGSITVSLSYDPPTRHSRFRDYLGVRMQFGLFKNSDPGLVYDAIRAWSKTETDDLDGAIPKLSDIVPVALDPGVNTRNKGTLQRGREVVSTANWGYDGRAMILAVVCRRAWAPMTVEQQRFAVVVSIAHDNSDVDLYAHLSQRASVFQQARVRIRG
jgi:subtilisin family serine protease